jgi:hypothetical protein
VLQERGCEFVNCIEMTAGRVQWLTNFRYNCDSSSSRVGVEWSRKNSSP